MGIATALVRSWEDGTSRPDNRQLKVLASLLGLMSGLTPSFFPTRRKQSQLGFPVCPVASLAKSSLHRAGCGRVSNSVGQEDSGERPEKIFAGLTWTARDVVGPWLRSRQPQQRLCEALRKTLAYSIHR
jgi:hypothetical protein